MRLRGTDTLLAIAVLLLAGFLAGDPADVDAGPQVRQTPAQPTADPDDPDCEDEEVEVPAVDVRSRTLTRRPVSQRARGRTTDVPDRRAMRVNDDLVERALEVARDLNPATARRLQTLREKDPQAFQASLATTGRRLLALAELKRRDRQLYRFKLSELEYEQRVQRTADRLRTARAAVLRGESSPAKVEILEAQLRTEIKMLVALSLPARAIYLKRLEEHLEKLRAEIDAAANDFEETVEDRFRQLMAADVDHPPS